MKFSKEYQPQEKWTEEKALQLANDLLKWMTKPSNLFFEEFLVIENNIHPNTIKYLSNKFPSFCERVEHAKKIQEIKIKKGSISDELNTAMSKFILNVNHSHIEKREQKIETSQQPVKIHFTTDGN